MTALKFCLMIPFTEQYKEEMKCYTEGGIWGKKMKGRRKREKRSRREKDIIKVKIPENCYKCIWGAKPTIQQAKIKCTKKDAEVVKEDEDWMCCSYSNKKMLEEKNYRKESSGTLVN